MNDEAGNVSHFILRLCRLHFEPLQCVEMMETPTAISEIQFWCFSMLYYQCRDLIQLGFAVLPRPVERSQTCQASIEYFIYTDSSLDGKRLIAVIVEGDGFEDCRGSSHGSEKSQVE